MGVPTGPSIDGIEVRVSSVQVPGRSSASRASVALGTRRGDEPLLPRGSVGPAKDPPAASRPSATAARLSLALKSAGVTGQSTDRRSLLGRRSLVLACAELPPETPSLKVSPKAPSASCDDAPAGGRAAGTLGGKTVGTLGGKTVGTLGGKTVGKLDATLPSRRDVGESVGKLAADDQASSKEAASSDGIGIAQAIVVLFCKGLGNAVPLCPQFARDAGWLGFIICIVIAAVLAAISETMMFKACRDNAVVRLSDLSAGLPGVINKLTKVAFIGWALVCVSKYCEFVFEGIVNQYYGFSVQDAQWKSLSYSEYMAKSLPIYICLFIANFLAGIPPNVGGAVGKLLFCHINLCAMWIYIIVILVKGMDVLIYGNGLGGQTETPAFTSVRAALENFAVLIGAMMMASSVPWVNSEMKPHLREKGGNCAGIIVAAAQGLLLGSIGLVGFFARGQHEETLAYSVGGGYDSGAWQKPLQNILQVSLSVKMFLSIPLAALPCKIEVYSLLPGPKDGTEKVPFDASPFRLQMTLNFVFAGITTFLPMFCRTDLFLVILKFGSGMFANWVNTFVIAAILFAVQVQPARRSGEPYLKALIAVIAVFVTALICLSVSVTVQVPKAIDLLKGMFAKSANEQ